MSTGKSFKLSEAELKQDPEEVFTVLDKLGEGSYGAVFKAMHKKSGLVVALKIVPVDNDLDDIVKEINVMNGCDCEAIVRYYGSFFKNEHLWMFIEFCPAGSVSDIMKLTKQYLGELEISAIVKACLEGLEYLHSRRKIHRDIKAGNILLNQSGEAKLADFGVAGQLSETVAKRNTVIGTPFWMAPEIIQEVGYGVEADIWSLGITCIEMAEGKPPLYNIHPMRAIFIIPTKPSPTLENTAAFSPLFNDFIARCLTKTPHLRPTATALLKDPFITQTAAMPGTLREKVVRTSELIAQGILATAGDSDDEEEDKSATSTKPVPAAVKANGTIMPSATSKKSNDQKQIQQQADELSEEFSTMVVNNSQSSTMLPASKGLKKVETGTMKPVGKSNSDAPKPQQQSNLKESDSVRELNELLKALEDNMEREIAQIKLKYDQKRLPIFEAINSKKNTAV